MKRHLSIIMILYLICTFAVGCSDNNQSTPDSQSTPSNSQTADSVDVDLSVMSTTLAAAEFQKITTTPSDYLGKTIKISGTYEPSYFDQTDTYYHYVVLEGADACCAQGMEFIWNGEHSYPDDYPTAQTKIEVVGVFGSENELGETYYYLAIDDITVLT